MKPFLALVLILSVVALSGLGSVSTVTSNPMSGAQLSATMGAGFRGGAICGLAAGAAVIAGAAIIGAATAGTTLPLAVCFGFSLGAHISAICAMLH
jgi:cyanophycinase-like exopeptidase